MILETMLQRLFASLVNGPCMNARPHRSRQRCDVLELAVFQGLDPAEGFRRLMEKGKVEFPASVPLFVMPEAAEADWSDTQKTARDNHQRQVRLLKKLRGMADDATDYLNDHGESCLALGFPLLSLSPGEGVGGRSTGGRILAPVALLPINLLVRSATRPGVVMETLAEGADLLVPNPSLIAWLERQTGKPLGDVFSDDEGRDPWKELAELILSVRNLLDIKAPFDFAADVNLAAVPSTETLPKTPILLASAVMGLFPLSNQSLLKDTRWMLDQQADLKEPAAAFLSPKALHPEPELPPADAPFTESKPGSSGKRNFETEWLVSVADPCQANAVLAAREAKALVVHGPPGTGKSQTIMNMIADHLARGERVLFVCDKRTALDVVKYRLDAAGLGDLCGVIHDPSADRKDFYLGLRTQLENMVEATLIPDPSKSLNVLNQQLSKLHAELEDARQRLHLANPNAESGGSFHDLLGRWLPLAARQDLPQIETTSLSTTVEVETGRTDIQEVCRHSENCGGYARNPFRGLLSTNLGELLSRSESEIRGKLELVNVLAVAASQCAITTPLRLPVRTGAENALEPQFQGCQNIARLLERIAAAGEIPHAKAVLANPAASQAFPQAEMAECVRLGEIGHLPELEWSLLPAARSAGFASKAAVDNQLGILKAWEPNLGSFLKKLLPGAEKKAAMAVMTPLGLNAKLPHDFARARAFFEAVRPRLILLEALDRVAGHPAASPSLPEDPVLIARAKLTLDLLEADRLVQAHGVLLSAETPLSPQGLREAVEFPDKLRETARHLVQQANWLRAHDALGRSLAETGLFRPEALHKLLTAWVQDTTVPPRVKSGMWLEKMATIESVVRAEAALENLPLGVRQAVVAALDQEADATTVMPTVLRHALNYEIQGRLKQDPKLARIDGARMEAAFETFLNLSREKPELVRQHIRFRWQNHQRSRLLAGTGSQLNRLGSALRQRLFVRGKKSLKLRQMLATGEGNEAGDPIYDLCPVWMASPSTVAQIFPRHAIFDVVIFDEASQCRLEEALPVLLRGLRVVIAGDQKQLPPTRFFESALTEANDSDAETAEELFYQQQQDAEDLLSAALNLDVREAYLDVHYRSMDESLIGFSNQHYYGSRLQAMPGHPKNRALTSAIRVENVDGVYQDRTNPKEAQAAVDLVAELLAESEPPSIGIACFNITQKEAILEALSARCAADKVFAERFEIARHRKGRDSFEGLFVKNLENVQGDERDVMIISTTFGCDAQGRFRRNFGTLSQREGGRRLNVLVTRARSAVHILTSIPATEYQAVQDIPPGSVLNGRLQLYAYLRYAEEQTALHERALDTMERLRRNEIAGTRVRPSSTPSHLATAMAKHALLPQGVGSVVHWGNDGFCVDIACTHPTLPADVTIGVLTDFTRFHKTPDPIAWDAFRTEALRSQGWELHRVWSPLLYRRPVATVDEVVKRHASF